MTWHPGKHFDDMIKVTENNLTGEPLGVMRKILRQAKLFVLEEPAHLILPKEYSEEDTAWYQNNLHLPFPITAIEDPASVVLLQRVMDREDPTVLPIDDLNVLFYAWIPAAYDENSRSNQKHNHNYFRVPYERKHSTSPRQLGRDYLPRPQNFTYNPLSPVIIQTQ